MQGWAIIHMIFGFLTRSLGVEEMKDFIKALRAALSLHETGVRDCSSFGGD